MVPYNEELMIVNNEEHSYKISDIKKIIRIFESVEFNSSKINFQQIADYIKTISTTKIRAIFNIWSKQKDVYIDLLFEDGYKNVELILEQLKINPNISIDNLSENSLLYKKQIMKIIHLYNPTKHNNFESTINYLNSYLPKSGEGMYLITSIVRAMNYELYPLIKRKRK